MLTPRNVIYRRRYLDDGIERAENLTVGILKNGVRYESIALPQLTSFIVVVEPNCGPISICTLDGIRFRSALAWRFADAREVPGDIQELFDRMVDESIDRLETAEAERRVSATWQKYGKFDARAALHCSQAFRDKMLARLLAEIRHRGLVFPTPTRT